MIHARHARMSLPTVWGGATSRGDLSHTGLHSIRKPRERCNVGSFRIECSLKGLGFRVRVPGGVRGHHHLGAATGVRGAAPPQERQQSGPPGPDCLTSTLA